MPDAMPAVPSQPIASPSSANDASDDALMFELAPVSLWLEDFSGVKQLFEAWRAQGVTDLRAHFKSDPAHVSACSRRIRVIKVNRRTLAMFNAPSLDTLVANLPRVFRDDMLKTHIEELCQLWDGRTHFTSKTVNYTLDGRRLDVLLNGSVLPGHEATFERVLISLEDVTELEHARERVTMGEQYARGLFEYSPVSLWVEDFSAIKLLLDDARSRGITDFRTFTDVHPEFVERCMNEIHVLDVNRHTLAMFVAPDKTTLLSRLPDVFRDDMRHNFREQLIDLWDNKLFQQREVVKRSTATRSTFICNSRCCRATSRAGIWCSSHLRTSRRARRPSRISNSSANTTCSPSCATARSMSTNSTGSSARGPTRSR
ncbi:hypothetical protein LMG16407_00248 [Pandoraea apista]|nr:hypothetical protein LMG16407_00248 [Pandoraea apista]